MMEKEFRVLPEGFILSGKTYTYRIDKVLGQGSFGITYLATTRVTFGGELGSLETTIKVALKEFFMNDINGRDNSLVTCSGQSGLYENYKKKFTREAKNLSTLHHPGIVKVLEYFEANNTVYYSMEYCGGGDLNTLIESGSGLTESESLKYFTQISSALSFMHSKQVLHLDLKPSNVVLRDTGDVALIDFGLSKHYDSQGIPESSTTIGGGTPGYAPIEQGNYQPGDTLATTLDVYALGATLYKMLTGKRPPLATDIFNDGFPKEDLRKRHISEPIISCIEKAMSSAKRQRYQTVDEFMTAMSLAMESLKDKCQCEATEINQSQSEETEVATSSKAEHSPKVVESEIIDSTNKRSDSTQYNSVTTSRLGTAHRIFVVTVLLLLALVVVSTMPTVLFFYGNVLWKLQCDNTSKSCYEIAAYKGHCGSMNELGHIYRLENNFVESIKWYELAARDDEDGRASFEIGRLYQEGIMPITSDGIAVENSTKEAIKWYNKAADLGHVESKVQLGHIYCDGEGVVRNYATAIKWFEEAANQGNAEAQFCLGELYEKGKGVKKNKEEAMRWYQQSSNLGYSKATEALARFDTFKDLNVNNIEINNSKNSKAQKNTSGNITNSQIKVEDKPVVSNQQIAETTTSIDIGADITPASIPVVEDNDDRVLTPSELYNKGVMESDKENYSKAVEWYLQAAEQGHRSAQYNLGVMYDNGMGVNRDYAEAAKWYRKAAEQGIVQAQFTLAYFYDVGQGVAQNHAEAAKWYRKAAEQGHEAAQHNLGLLYDNGTGVNKDYAEAAKWYRKAADQGSLSAQCNLGILYEYGRGVSQNYTEAAKWYRKAAEQGHKTSQYNLGILYDNGTGVSRDYVEAAKWYRKAADQGSLSAQCNLGILYEYGRGVTQSYTEAIKWYRKAAEQGNISAQYNLGRIYKEGLGVTVDIEEARKWLQKAASRGHSSAKSLLEQL